MVRNPGKKTREVQNSKRRHLEREESFLGALLCHKDQPPGKAQKQDQRKGESCERKVVSLRGKKTS